MLPIRCSSQFGEYAVSHTTLGTITWLADMFRISRLTIYDLGKRAACGLKLAPIGPVGSGDGLCGFLGQKSALIYKLRRAIGR